PRLIWLARHGGRADVYRPVRPPHVAATVRRARGRSRVRGAPATHAVARYTRPRCEATAGAAVERTGRVLLRPEATSRTRSRAPRGARSLRGSIRTDRN